MARFTNILATFMLFTIFLKLGTLGSVIRQLGLGQSELFSGMLLATLASLVSLRLAPLKPDESDTAPAHLGINLGGGIVPLFFLLYFYRIHPFSLVELALLTPLVTTIVYCLTHAEKQYGLIIYLFGAVIAAALGALLLDPVNYLTLAYASAVLGTLIGGDLLHLKEIKKLSVRSQRSVFIGGGGLLDAIFQSGLLAMLTAETLHMLQIP